MRELFESDEPNEEDRIDPMVELITKIAGLIVILGAVALAIIDTYLDWMEIQRIWP